jgi:hypothetical protein
MNINREKKPPETCEELLETGNSPPSFVLTFLQVADDLKW